MDTACLQSISRDGYAYARVVAAEALVARFPEDAKGVIERLSTDWAYVLMEPLGISPSSWTVRDHARRLKAEVAAGACVVPLVSAHSEPLNRQVQTFCDVKSECSDRLQTSACALGDAEQKNAPGRAVITQEMYRYGRYGPDWSDILDALPPETELDLAAEYPELQATVSLRIIDADLPTALEELMRVLGRDLPIVLEGGDFGRIDEFQVSEMRAYLALEWIAKKCSAEVTCVDGWIVLTSK